MDDISTDSRRLVRFGVFELDPLTVVLACVERAPARRAMRKSSFLLVSYLVLGVSAPVLAQRTTATLRGTVVDSSTALIPGATVTAKNDDTGLTRSTATNVSGTYALPDLPIGRYRVTAELQGFKSASRTGIILRVADDYVVDFTLETGEFNDVVTVEASSTPVKVVGGDVSGVITGQQARELPLNGRNFMQLATLMPGVSEHDFLNVKDKGLLGGAFLSVSGSGVTANLWTVDGANNNDFGTNATMLVYPSLEAIEELKILRNSYGPEFGGAGGAQINVVTRGGTNQFRGSGFYFVRNDAFNSTDYFLEKNNQPKSELQRNDFGGFVGGPILKDKLFVFGGLEWNLEDRGSARVAQVPTLAERNGDFSAGPVCGTAPGIPIDPTSGRPFDGNRIPSDRISPGGRAFLSLFPLPNVAAAGESCNNWVTSVTSPIDYRQEHVRGDWSIGNSARLMVRYTHDSWKNDAPSFQSNLWGDDPFPSVDSNWDYARYVVRHVAEPDIWNERDQQPSVLVLRQPNHGPARRRPRAECPHRDCHPAHLPDPKQTARCGHRSPALVGRERIRGSVERGAVRQQSGPVRPEGRLHEGLRQALRQGRRARQLQQEKRRHHRKRLVAEPGLLGLDRSQWLWRDDGQHPGRLPARGHGVWIFRVVGGASGSDAVARRRGLLR